ncbi:hypothetical protein QYE76_056792 [Lolium multiflorum]|uniref:F-box domain-containing protein n=1 Tax=Lolium multiflorum TaxID=4521 RepID=A0AAD8WQ81_LOLMU|nr:hypothetical protein QYE76_056792 [Lolium multiflorum]
MGKRNSRQVLPRPRQINTGAMGKKGSRDDRLSALPDDILVNILDRLNVREAARTSILSKRWIRLSSELSHLIINAKEFVLEGVSNSNASVDDLVQINAAAVEGTKGMLARRVPGEYTIRLLSTTFYLRDVVPISIGHAVGNAMATHKIEKAEFTLLTEKERLQCTFDDIVNYGAQFVSFFNECQVAFSGLTRLYLQNLKFAESDVVSNILVTCGTPCDPHRRATGRLCGPSLEDGASRSPSHSRLYGVGRRCPPVGFASTHLARRWDNLQRQPSRHPHRRWRKTHTVFIEVAEETRSRTGILASSSRPRSRPNRLFPLHPLPGIGTNVVKLGYHPGEGSDEGGCSHGKGEEADPSGRTISHAPPALPVFGVDLSGDGKRDSGSHRTS